MLIVDHDKFAFFYIATYFTVPCLAQLVQASQFREKYDLEGSCAEDICKSGCCLFCSLMQTEKEAKVILGDRRTGMDGVIQEQYAAGAEEQMFMPGQEAGHTGAAPQ